MWIMVRMTMRVTMSMMGEDGGGSDGYDYNDGASGDAGEING